MTWNTAQKVVDFVFDATPPGRKMELSFFGGEPLLRFDLIAEIVGYVRKKEQETRKPVALSITTNGTLLRQSMLEFFKAENIDLCISIDGPAPAHDANRVYRNGQGSFAKVMRSLQMAMNFLNAVQVNAVYGPETLNALPSTVSFFTNLGVPVIHLNPNICASWTADALPELQAIYMRIAEHYIQSYQRGLEIAVNIIDSKLILFLKGGYTFEDMCGMGETEWGFAPSGNIYPCERFIGEDDNLSFCLGSIHSGIDLTKRCLILSKRGNHNEECKTCKLRPYCMNWCGCTNYFMTGNTDLAGPFLCAMERAAISAAEHVFITLSELNNDLFVDHLLQYVHKGRHFR
jgi:uncharacterized protein